LRDLVDFLGEIHAKKVGLYLHQQGVDTSTPAGKLLLHVLGALAEFEPSLIAERTSAGRAAARARGVRFGRPSKLSAQQMRHAAELRDAGKRVVDIAALLNVHPVTCYRALSRIAPSAR
jgi:DNA invertase Pin-like site-specific DNA recombinase